MISCRDCWSWTQPSYITVTRRQSNNQWSGGIAGHPTPKNYECKNPLESILPWFLGMKTASFSLIIFQTAKQSMPISTHRLVQIEGTFEGKTPREGHQGSLVLARQGPGSLGTCNPEETGLPGLPLSWSRTLFSGSGPVGLPPVPWTEKKQLKVRHFSSDAEVIAAAETWLDGQTSDFFFSGLQKLQQRAKKCIGLRGEYTE